MWGRSEVKVTTTAAQPRGGGGGVGMRAELGAVEAWHYGVTCQLD